MKEGKVYIPKDKELRVEVIRLHNDVQQQNMEGN